MRIERSTDLRVATAGWGIPQSAADHFPSEGTNLARYAACFDAVEINSTFYRSHRPSTYARWAATTPAHFRFAVKLPRSITHEARLIGTAPLLSAFREETQHLGTKRGPVLIQLPPSLMFEAPSAARFFSDLRELWPEAVVCEPRHPSWFADEADLLLRAYRIGRVAADPARHSAGAAPGGWRGVSYWRLHGSPRTYYSSYSDAQLSSLASALQAKVGEVWCVFDNTASGAAANNALRLLTISA